MAEDREIEELGKESASPYVINQMFGLRQKLEPTEKEWEKKKESHYIILRWWT